MNDGGAEGNNVILIDKPTSPTFGDLNYAHLTGLINLAYGRYHDPFLNVPLSENALGLIDPESESAYRHSICVNRESTCQGWNSKYADGRLEKILELNRDQPIYESVLGSEWFRFTVPSAHGGPVDPEWYDWTTTPPTTEAALAAAAATTVAEVVTDTTTTTTGAATDPALNPNPYFANNCTCQYKVDDGELVGTLVFSAGAASLLAGLLCAKANWDLRDDWDDSICGGPNSVAEDESFEQMLAE